MRMRQLLPSLFVVSMLAAASHATPIPVTFFHSPGDDGVSTTGTLPVPGGNITINLWADPTAAAGGVTFEVQDVVLQVSGAVQVFSFTCDSGQGGCLAGTPTATSSSFTPAVVDRSR